jgi:hypothetical protein
MKVSLATTLLVFAAFPCGAATAASRIPDSLATDSGRLTLTAASSRDRYVLGEPVRITVLLRNESTRTIWVPDDDAIPFEVDVVYGPDRETVNVCAIVASHASLFPLPPGQSVFRALYPDSLATRYERDSWYPGERRVIIWYRRPYGGGHDTGPGEAISNELVIALEEPTRAEREIMHALQESMYEGSSLSCLAVHTLVTKKRAEAVIRKYPNERLTNYARYALARASIETQYEKQDLAMGLEMLQEIMGRDPTFYPEEVRWLAAQCIRYAHARPQATRMLGDLLRENPALNYSDRFMFEYIQHRFYEVYSPVDPYSEWRRRRERGELRLEDYLLPDSTSAE